MITKTPRPEFCEIRLDSNEDAGKVLTPFGRDGWKFVNMVLLEHTRIVLLQRNVMVEHVLEAMW